MAGITVAAAPSAARTATANGATLDGCGTYSRLRVQLDVTAVSGTTPTLDCVVEDTHDGVSWNTIGTFTQKTAVAREVINVTTPFTDRVRVRWTIGGTTPSFTFSASVYAQ
jgi:hypothetical protein